MSAGSPRLSEPNKKGVVFGVLDPIIPLRALGRDREETARTDAFRACGPILVHHQRGEFMIVEARPQELLIFQGKAQRLYQMEAGAGVGAQPDDVAGVRGNLRTKKNDVEHRHRIDPSKPTGHRRLPPSLNLPTLGVKRLNIPRLAQHFIHFIEMHFFAYDHLSGILLQQNRFPFH